jgi:ATP-dependent Clp protease ATP-binding subunit ClpA
MFERYTENARRAIFFARYEASQFGSPSIETEHVLLGVLREDRGLVGRLLMEGERRVESLSEDEARRREDLRRVLRDVNPLSSGEPWDDVVAGIRRQIEANTTPREKVSTSGDLPLSHESQRVLSYGAEEAHRLNHRHIGTEHLLLGLLREEKCFAAEILRERGLSLSQAREQIARSAPSEAAQGGEQPREIIGPRSLAVRFAGQAGWMSALQDGGRAVLLSRHEAAQRHSACIETTDLLLALAHEKELSDRFPGLTDSVRKHRKPEAAPQHEKVSAEEIPFSEDCKLAFAFAIEEAAQLGQRTGPKHLLLGILRVESCAAAEVLRECGFTEAGIRAQLVPPPPPSSDPEQGRSYV